MLCCVAMLLRFLFEYIEITDKYLQEEKNTVIRINNLFGVKFNFYFLFIYYVIIKYLKREVGE